MASFTMIPLKPTLRREIGPFGQASDFAKRDTRPQEMRRWRLPCIHRIGPLGGWGTNIQYQHPQKDSAAQKQCSVGVITPKKVNLSW